MGYTFATRNRESLSSTLRLVTLSALAVWVCACLPTGPGHREFLSKEHKVIRRTLPKEGTRFTEKFLLITDQPGELVWLRQAELRTLEDGKEASEYLSQAEMSLLRPARHLQLHGLTQPIVGSIFRFGPGTESVKLPEGFGIPMNSNEALDLMTSPQCVEVVNGVRDVTFEIGLDYLRDRGRAEAIKALVCLQATALVGEHAKPLHFGVSEVDPQLHGRGTAPWTAATEPLFSDSLGQKFSDSWFVEPGTGESRTLQTKLFLLQKDTLVHHAVACTTPDTTNLELWDITEQKSVLELTRSETGQWSQFSSLKGVPIRAEHHYELVTTYENTSSLRQIGAASMMLYLADQEFLATQP